MSEERSTGHAVLDTQHRLTGCPICWAYRLAHGIREPESEPKESGIVVGFELKDD